MWAAPSLAPPSYLHFQDGCLWLCSMDGSFSYMYRLLRLVPLSNMLCHLSVSCRQIILGRWALGGFSSVRASVLCVVPYPAGCSYWQFSISSAPSQLVQSHLYVGSNKRNVASKGSNRSKEVPKQDKDTVQLDDETRQWPSQKDQNDASSKCSGALHLLSPGKEHNGLLDADDQGEADDKQNLAPSAIVPIWICSTGRTFPMASRDRSKNMTTPSVRNKPPPAQKATPISTTRQHPWRNPAWEAAHFAYLRATW